MNRSTVTWRPEAEIRKRWSPRLAPGGFYGRARGCQEMRWSYSLIAWD